MIVLHYGKQEGFGELHIKTSPKEGKFPECHYEFTLSLKPNETEKEGLLRAARDIINKLG